MADVKLNQIINTHQQIQNKDMKVISLIDEIFKNKKEKYVIKEKSYILNSRKQFKEKFEEIKLESNTT